MTHLRPLNESASDWLLHIAPVAKKLNEQSKREAVVSNKAPASNS